MKVKLRNSYYKTYKEIDLDELFKDVVLIVYHGYKTEFRKNEKRSGKGYWYFGTALPERDKKGDYVYSTQNKMIHFFDDDDWKLIHDYYKNKGIPSIYSDELPSESKKYEKTHELLDNRHKLWSFWEDNEEISAKFTYEEKTRWVEKRIRNYYSSKARKNKSLFHNNN